MGRKGPTDQEYKIGIKAAKAAGINDRDQTQWAVDNWRIHTGEWEAPKGWVDPYAAAKKTAKKTTKAATKKSAKKTTKK